LTHCCGHCKADARSKLDITQAAIRLRSAVRVMLEEIEKYQRNLDELCAKLLN